MGLYGWPDEDTSQSVGVREKSSHLHNSVPDSRHYSQYTRHNSHTSRNSELNRQEPLHHAARSVNSATNSGGTYGKPQSSNYKHPDPRRRLCMKTAIRDTEGFSDIQHRGEEEFYHENRSGGYPGRDIRGPLHSRREYNHPPPLSHHDTGHFGPKKRKVFSQNGAPNHMHESYVIPHTSEASRRCEHLHRTNIASEQRRVPPERSTASSTEGLRDPGNVSSRSNHHHWTSFSAKSINGMSEKLSETSFSDHLRKRSDEKMSSSYKKFGDRKEFPCTKTQKACSMRLDNLYTDEVPLSDLNKGAQFPFKYQGTSRVSQTSAERKRIPDQSTMVSDAAIEDKTSFSREKWLESLEELIFPHIGGQGPISVSTSMTHGRGVGSLMVSFEGICLEILQSRLKMSDQDVLDRMPVSATAETKSNYQPWFVTGHAPASSVDLSPEEFVSRLTVPYLATVRGELPPESSEEAESRIELYPPTLIRYYLDPDKVRDNDPRRYESLNKRFDFITRSLLWCLRWGPQGTSKTTTPPPPAAASPQSDTVSTESPHSSRTTSEGLPPAVPSDTTQEVASSDSRSNKEGPTAKDSSSSNTSKKNDGLTGMERSTELNADVMNVWLILLQEWEKHMADIAEKSRKCEEQNSSVAVPRRRVLFLSTDFMTAFEHALAPKKRRVPLPRESGDDDVNDGTSARGRQTTMKWMPTNGFRFACERVFKYFSRRNLNPWEWDLICWPINYISAHWVLLTVDMGSKEMIWSDSYRKCYLDALSASTKPQQSSKHSSRYADLKTPPPVSKDSSGGTASRSKRAVGFGAVLDYETDTSGAGAAAKRRRRFPIRASYRVTSPNRSSSPPKNGLQEEMAETPTSPLIPGLMEVANSSELLSLFEHDGNNNTPVAQKNQSDLLLPGDSDEEEEGMILTPQEDVVKDQQRSVSMESSRPSGTTDASTETEQEDFKKKASSFGGWLYFVCAEEYLKYDFMRRRGGESLTVEEQDMVERPWKRVVVEGLPQQSKFSLDCGVYAAHFARNVAQFESPYVVDFGIKDVPRLRRIMAVLIGRGALPSCPRQLVEELIEKEGMMAASSLSVTEGSSLGKKCSALAAAAAAESVIGVNKDVSTESVGCQPLKRSKLMKERKNEMEID